MQRSHRLPLIALPLLLTTIIAVNPCLATAANAASEETSVASAPERLADSKEPAQHDPAAYAQKRLTRLKAELRITPDQEAQWSAFSAAVLQQMEQLNAAHSAMTNPATSAPERIDRKIESMKQRLAGFEAMGQAAKALYATLSPSQQHIADEKLLRWHGKHMKGHDEHTS